jgi:hypothetical protein
VSSRRKGSIVNRPRNRPANRSCLPRALTLVTLAAALAAGLLLAAGAVAALASPLAGPLAQAAPPTINNVIDSLTRWLVGILAALATLFLTIGGIRYMTAGGDPAQVERAKTALKSAVVGYALAALAPVLVDILRSVVGA